MLFSHESALPDAEPRITLRLYQETCVECVLATYQRQPHGGTALIVIPTGGGKTIVFTEIARQLKLNTLIIAHRQELLQQAADKFRIVEPTAIIGQVGGGRFEWGAPVTCASIQTISRPEHRKNLKLFGYGLVIIDEGHHAWAESYQSVLRELRDAFILAVTATPDRSDKRRIESLFGEPVFFISILDLVEQGHLCDLRAFAIQTATSLSGLSVSDGDYEIEELEQIIDNPERNETIVRAYLTRCKGRQGLCFGVTIEHAKHLSEMFNHFGIPAAFVSGDQKITPLEERRRILHDFERGILQIVANCGVLIEGYDCPQVSCIIMARPTGSRALYTQCIGRGTRKAPGKTDCIILDITDNVLKLRLEPLTLGKTLEKSLRPGESLRQCQKREEREKSETGPVEPEEKQERTTIVTKRTQDLPINILTRFVWKRAPSGAYHLEVGKNKHRIILRPSETKEGYYSVWAKLAPTFKPQQWMKEIPLEWAQQHAEMKARLIQADDTKLVLVDSQAAWRAHPASIKQLYMLRKYGIPYEASITAGEASDLIGREKVEREQRKAEKKAESATKSTRRRGKGTSA